jgi:Mg-chelatase subunit ChlD
MAGLYDLEQWCWKGERHNISNDELFALAKQLRGKKEISKQEIQQAINQAVGQSGKGNEETNKSLDDAIHRLHEEIGKKIFEAFHQKPNAIGGSPEKYEGERLERDHSNTDYGAEHNNGKIESEAGQRKVKSRQNITFQQIAMAMLEEIGRELFDTKTEAKLTQKGRDIKNLEELFDFVGNLSEAFKQCSKDKKTPLDFEYSKADSKDNQFSNKNSKTEAINGLASRAGGSDAVNADGFNRFPYGHDEQESFEGVNTFDVDDVFTQKKGSLSQRQNLLPRKIDPESLLNAVIQVKKQKERLQKKIEHRFPVELNQETIRAMVEQLIELNVISPTFVDTFQINKDRIAFFLAKEAFLSMLKIFVRRHPLRKGTHSVGRRGMADLQLDRTERARHFTSRLAVVHTLRRGLARRILYPSSLLVEEDDLVEYGSRRKVGYSVVIAIDTSGAVQFGKRIQGVRKACLAFGYYLKKYQPNDRVYYITYHEVPRVISFSDVFKVKAINGAGKDIGGCLELCQKVLAKDPDRVPMVVLIGDGLPARGDKAGFYNFMENNHAIIEKAYHHAHLLRKKGVLFTFLQFREDRHLWMEYSDGAAHRITKEAKGMLYQIDNPRDIVPSLIQTYHRYRDSTS